MRKTESSQSGRKLSQSDFGIVIPHLDYSDHLSQCLMSILLQEGDFFAHIHVQDGGHGEHVGKLLAACGVWMDNSRFLLTYSQEPDSGAAEAINRGMKQLDAELVTWLGADDMLMPGSLQAVMTLKNQFPSIEWVTGLPHIVSQEGVPVPSYGAAGFYRFPTGFSSHALKRGLHAGEVNHGFIQQEGTFWSSSLWSKVGGLDEGLKLAFDFDLWCRMAQFAELVEVVAPLGAFRKREGQASGDMEGYLDEVSNLRQKYLELHGKVKPGLRAVSVSYLDSRTYRWRIGKKRFLVLGQRLGLKIPLQLSIEVTRFTFAAKLRKRSPTSKLSRMILVLAGRIRR